MSIRRYIDHIVRRQMRRMFILDRMRIMDGRLSEMLSSVAAKLIGARGKIERKINSPSFGELATAGKAALDRADRKLAVAVKIANGEKQRVPAFVNTAGYFPSKWQNSIVWQERKLSTETMMDFIGKAIGILTSGKAMDALRGNGENESIWKSITNDLRDALISAQEYKNSLGAAQKEAQKNTEKE